ncbi:MAG TPA: efflux RND transporter periplasmic adaptor subunit [Alphaproteobacteria bacterium]|nr:efflux RND transporter periplasmic adaptor subunit [Alphaproteobacteria bacterium]
MSPDPQPLPPETSRRLKRRILIAAGLIVIIIVGLFVFRFASAPHGPPPGAAMGVPVVTENPRPEKTTGTVQAVGTLRADQSISIAPEVDGRIASIPGAEGQAVKKGDLLVQLDTAITKADLDEAEANLALAEATYGRTRNLAARQFATRQSEDEAMANLRQMQAKAASAKAHFDKTAIAAPFDGTLGLRQKSVGAYVKAGEVILTLTSIDPIFVDFRIPELQSGRVAPGQKVSVTIDALSATPVEGEVTAVDPALDEAGRSLAVRAKLPNPDGKLRAGMFAHVTLAYGAARDVLVVPERAVFLRADGLYVYRADKDGKAELVKVEPGERRVGELEVLKGLEASDDIVTDGQIKVMPGAKLMLLSKPNLPPGQKPTEAPKTPEKPPETAPEVKPGTPPAEADKPAPPADAAKPEPPASENSGEKKE